MSALSICILVGLALLVGGMVGYMAGDRNGRACEWCDEYFARIEREKARRDERGRFKAKAAP